MDDALMALAKALLQDSGVSQETRAAAQHLLREWETYLEAFFKVGPA